MSDTHPDIEVLEIELSPPPRGAPPHFRELLALALKTTDSTTLDAVELGGRESSISRTSMSGWVSLMARVPPVDRDSGIPDHVEELREGAEYIAAQDTAPVDELDQEVFLLRHGSERGNPERVPHAEDEIPSCRGDLCPMCSHRCLPFHYGRPSTSVDSGGL